MDNNEKDYFQFPDEIPPKVQTILDSFNSDCDNSYTELARITFELRAIGWDMDFGLDAEPFDLKPILSDEK